MTKTSKPAFTFRRALDKDVTPLAKLHTVVWQETYSAIYPHKTNFPSVALRVNQWNHLFGKNNGTWFCTVIENEAGKLIGFAKGQDYNNNDWPDCKGELNKIYLLQQYHHLGLGRQLLRCVFDEFLAREIFSIILFSDPKNPAGKFFVQQGAEKIYSDKGEFNGEYVWRDIGKLA